MTPRDPGPSRAAILKAAGTLLEECGPASVTLRSVGDAADLSRSAPYRHFADKATLMRALAQQTLEQLAEAVRAAALDGGDGGLLRRGCEAYVDYALANPHHYQLIFGDSPIAEPDAGLEAAADQGMLAIRELVEHGQVVGALPAGPERELATVLWVFLHGLAQLQLTGHLHEPRTISGDVGMAALLDLFLRSLRPEARSMDT